MNMLSGLLTPKLGFGLIKSQLESQLDLKVKNFELIYTKLEDVLKIRIEEINGKKRTVEFDDKGNKLSVTIQKMLKQYLADSVKIDAFKVGVTDGKIGGQIFYQTPDMIKEFIEINLK